MGGCVASRGLTEEAVEATAHLESEVGPLCGRGVGSDRDETALG